VYINGCLFNSIYLNIHVSSNVAMLMRSTFKLLCTYVSISIEHGEFSGDVNKLDFHHLAGSSTKKQKHDYEPENLDSQFS
jgi:hypothetical protein